MKTTKITLATVKSFMKKNAGNIYINVTSNFDGMHDCVMPENDGFQQAKLDTRNNDKNFGIAGAWFVGQSRDHFEAYEDDKFTGYRVSNSCGSFVLAIQKEATTEAEQVEDMGSITINPNVPTAQEQWADKIAKAEQSAEIADLIGKKVIRKACKRTGEIVAIDFSQPNKTVMTIELEDGSKRQPNYDRFTKLYNFA